MKKSLLAVAAIGAFASAAQAQSSVTVYGILDVGYQGGQQKATVGNAKTSQQINQFGGSGETSSRLGFKGTEDLGGGLSAIFTAEIDITPTSSDLFSNAGSATNRQAFVGLTKKGLGTAAIGTQYTTIHDSVAATSPTGNTNVIGDVIYPRASGLTGATSNANGSNVGYTLRQNNMLKFNSEKFAGFGVNGFYNLANANTNQTTTSTTITGGTNNLNGWGLSVDYAWQKLYVTAAFQQFKSEISADDGTNPTPAAATALSSGVVADTTDNQSYVGASYDFGILKAYAQYLNRKATGVNNSNQYASRTAEQIGVRSFITPKIEAWVSGGLGRYQAFGASQPTANFTAYQLGSNYWLSKRTNLYAIFGSTNTSSVNIPTSGTAAFSGNNYAVGVRHTF